MPEIRTLNSHSRSRRRYGRRTPGGELHRIILAIQDLTLELAELKRANGPEAELEAKELELEQLRWRLAAVARRSAAEDTGAAA